MRIVNSEERRRRLPYPDILIWQMERQGKFPRRGKRDPANPGSGVGWVESEVDDWPSGSPLVIGGAPCSNEKSRRYLPAAAIVSIGEFLAILY
jgi:predicted DNA-binding transcriptional regulator AlpA